MVRVLPPLTMRRLPEVRPSGPGHRPQVDAAVAEKTAVLILQQGLEKSLRDRLHPGETPLLVSGQAGVQQPAVGGEAPAKAGR